MHRKSISRFLLAAGGVCGALAAHAQSGMSGEQVYQQVCVACHATGVDKAPKFGDRTMWAPLIKEGQSKLTADAWIGVRGMPPKGGKPDLALEDFSRGVVHMARAAGANWKDPDAAMLANIRKRVQSRLDSLKAKK
jgi:cytochrome c5